MLGVIVLLLIGVIAYFHTCRVCSAHDIRDSPSIAAMIAVSYHENVINLLFKGAMANYAEAMMLVAMFVVRTSSCV